jgi:putative ABC transport system permease protein
MLNDIRYAWRAFTRAPGFTLTAAFTLAVGIGANTAIFSVVYALLLKPLPFRDPEELIYLHDEYPAVANASVSWEKFIALRDGSRTLASLAATTAGTLTLTGNGEPQRLLTTRVSGDFFDVLGVRPLAGRGIMREDDIANGNPVIVLGYSLWQRVFSGATDILGQAITTDGQARTVIGIMPPGFVYPSPGEAWVPLALPHPPPAMNFLRLTGRLKPGASLAQATDDLKRATAVFNAQHNFQRGVRVYLLRDYLSQANRQMLLTLQGTVLLVLLIACANVANMLLARGVVRQRELSIRLAIGAGPGRLVRQLLTESVMLAMVGGGLGVLLASWLLRLFLALAPAGFSGVQTIAIDRHVLTFTIAVAVLTGLVFGLAPARRGFHTDANDGLRGAAARGSSGGLRGASRLLVVAEVGLAMVLVVGAGLMVKSLLKLETQDAGFRAGGLLTFQLDLPASRYDNDGARRAMARILDDVRTIPGVKAAGAINFLPLVNFGFNGRFSIQGRPPFAPADRAPVVEYRMVTPDYFAAMNIPVRRGAEFTARETDHDRPVVIINETMARQFWPTENPIGARVQLDLDSNEIVREVVGVVGDVRSQALKLPARPETFVPYAQVPANGMTIVVRSEVDPAALLSPIRLRIAGIDAALAIVKPQTMDAVVDASAGSMRLSSTLTTVFALLAALLASVGIYSLVSYSVARRTHEIGIRVALGANAASVLGLVIGEALMLAAAGLAVGLLGSRALTGTLRAMLYEVSPADPAVLAGTCAAVLLVTTGASFVPAWRVTRVDPTIALRVE